MQLTETLYVLFSVTLVTAGLALVALSVRAYQRTSHRSMMFLSIGFTFIVAAAIATTVSAFMNGFDGTLVLLTVNYLTTTIGYVFVIYSITGSE